MTDLPTPRRAHDLDGYDVVLTEVADLIERARKSVARSVNTTMTSLYWLIGHRIVESELGGEKRAG